MSDATEGDVLEECASCGHKADPAEMIADLTPSWMPTGKRVCRDPDACYERRLARDMERMPLGFLRDQSDALRRDDPGAGTGEPEAEGVQWQG